VVVLSVAAARDGSLWIATTEGLSHMQNDHFRNYTMADGLTSDRITTVIQDRGGGIWAATDAGVDHLVGDRFVPVRERQRKREMFPTARSKKTPSATSMRFRW
jgi:ligand-binding sensor domain-containing protein